MLFEALINTSNYPNGEEGSSMIDKSELKLQDELDALSCCNYPTTQNLLGSSFSLAALSTSTSNSNYKNSLGSALE